MKWIKVDYETPKCLTYLYDDFEEGEKPILVVGSDDVLVTDGEAVEEGCVLKGVWHTNRERVCAEEITHWMPMPNPPNSKTKEVCDSSPKGAHNKQSTQCPRCNIGALKEGYCESCSFNVNDYVDYAQRTFAISCEEIFIKFCIVSSAKTSDGVKVLPPTVPMIASPYDSGWYELGVMPVKSHTCTTQKKPCAAILWSFINTFSQQAKGEMVNKSRLYACVFYLQVATGVIQNVCTTSPICRSVVRNKGNLL